jgi:transposase
MFLSPYCPELNPIELEFGAIKTSLRSLQVLSRDTNPQWETQKSAADIFTAEFCHSVYEHCGYCVSEPN